MQIHVYDADNVFEWLNNHDQDLALNHLVEIWRQCALKEAEEARELEPEHKERDMMVLNLTERLRPMEAGPKVFEDVDSDEW
jgi:hypothetical protein